MKYVCSLCGKPFLKNRHEHKNQEDFFICYADWSKTAVDSCSNEYNKAKEAIPLTPPPPPPIPKREGRQLKVTAKHVYNITYNTDDKEEYDCWEISEGNFEKELDKVRYSELWPDCGYAVTYQYSVDVEEETFPKAFEKGFTLIQNYSPNK